MNLLSLLGIGVAAFASTNTDNLFLLTLLFAERRGGSRAIVFGEYAACILVLAIGAFAMLLREAIPTHWLALLGFAPLTMGLSKAFRLFLTTEDAAQAGSIPPRTSAISVALLALAISGDNIAVYGALFATLPVWQVAILMTQFFIFLGILCIGAKSLASHPVAGSVLRRTAYSVMPLILIGIGLLLLSNLFK